jgi:hypothetical protein
VLYQARFETKSLQDLELRVGTQKLPSGKSLLMAEISGSRGCQSICRVKRMAKHTIGQEGMLDMSCKNLSPIAMKTDASLSFKGQPLIRFGNWLDGYREFSLKVTRNALGGG